MVVRRYASRSEKDSLLSIGSGPVPQRTVAWSPFLTGPGLSSLEQARDPDQNYCADKRHKNGADHPATGPESQKPEDPATHHPAENPENEVHHKAVPAAFHHQARKPAGKQSHDDPSEKSHIFLLVTGPDHNDSRGHPDPGEKIRPQPPSGNLLGFGENGIAGVENLGGI